MMRNIYICLLFSFTITLFAQQTFEADLTIKETYISTPEEAIHLFENALNSNDAKKAISLFPIEYSLSRIKLLDNVKRLGMINTNLYPYFSGFEGILPYYLINEFSLPYINIKLANLLSLYPEFELTNPINNNDELLGFISKMQIANSKLIVITINGKYEYTHGSLYHYSEAYVFDCTISCDENILSEESTIRVIKVDGRWRIESILL